MLQSKEYFENIDDFANISAEIFKFYKPKPEYSIETLIFKRFFVRNYLVWTSGYEDICIMWSDFVKQMMNSPKGRLRSMKDDLSCSCMYVLEYLYVYDCHDDYESHKNRLEIFINAYNVLYLWKKPRCFIDEMIMLIRFFKRISRKKRKKLTLNKENVI
jgi:hypothetical protein